MHLRVLSGAALAVSLALTVPALADYWDHNGSRMYMEETDANLLITYLQPRHGIAATGVTNGTQLFVGQEMTTILSLGPPTHSREDVSRRHTMLRVSSQRTTRC